MDPVVKVHESPYAAFANNPIWIIDPTGADSTYYNKNDGGGYEATLVSNDGGASNELFLLNPNGNCSFNGDCYIPINSENTLMGQETFKEGENGLLNNNFLDWLVTYSEENNFKDMNIFGLKKHSSGGYFDLAYAQGPVADAMKSLIEGNGGEMSSGNLDIYDKQGFYRRTITYLYTNALFLLPNGKYGNVNEAGNFTVGFAFGLSEQSFKPWIAADIWSIQNRGHRDAEYEQTLLKTGYALGIMRTQVLFWKKFQYYHFSNDEYEALKERQEQNESIYGDSPLYPK